MNFGTIVRSPVNGNVIYSIPFDQWLYFEYTQENLDVSRCQGILSPFKSPNFLNAFQMQQGENLDNVMEIWFRPWYVKYQDNSNAKFSLDEQFFVRYDRIEHLNDGRPRDTFIGRSKLHLLKRCRIFPPQDSISPPYRPNAPLRVPPHHTISDLNPDPIPLGAGAWTLPVSEGYDGSFPAGTAFPGTSTAHRMCQIVEYVKKYTNPYALADISIASPPAAGLTNHPIDLRFDNLLEVLQGMSAASWHGWYYKEISPGWKPVDFDLVPDPNNNNKWIFTTYAGPRGKDRSFDKVFGGGVDPVVLSVGNDNIIQPVVVHDWNDEKNRIIVGGKNEGTDRDVIVVQNADRQSKSPWNVIDHWVHSSKIPPFDFTGGATDGILDAIERGTSRLNEEAPRDEYTLIVRLTRSLRKGINLNKGDVVTANLFGTFENYQVREMKHIMSRTGGVTISITLGELDGRYFKGSDEFQKIILRQLEVERVAEYAGEAQ